MPEDDRTHQTKPDTAAETPPAAAPQDQAEAAVDPPFPLPLIAGGCAIMAVFVVVLTLWSRAAPIESAVVAPGVVSVDGHRKTIQHLEGGIVRRILVADGDRVTTGQPLIELSDVQPGATLNQIRSQLANTLQAVVSQQLFKRVDQPGMVPALEILVSTPAVRNLIRESRTFEIPNVIETNRQLGMNSLDNAIAELYFNGMISKEDAIAQAAYPEKLERALAA